jgi:hypothetical protein
MEDSAIIYEFNQFVYGEFYWDVNIDICNNIV